jgi:hypothetical protein
MANTAKWQIVPTIIDADNIEQNYNSYEITSSYTNAQVETVYIPATSGTVTLNLPTTTITGIEISADSPVKVTFKENAVAKSIFTSVSGLVMNMSYASGAAVASIVLSTTGSSAINATVKVYGT